LHKFVDEISIYLKAGNGGAGCISFRREKFIPLGGPDGGDGGKGGDVYFCADPRIINLSHLQKDREYKAENGKPGEGRNKSGRKGESMKKKTSFMTFQTLNHFYFAKVRAAVKGTLTLNLRGFRLRDLVSLASLLNK